MIDSTAQQTGAAMRWRAIQLAGVEAVYLVRLVVLAQLLAPEAFGLVAIGIAAIGLMLRVSDLGMVQALVQRPAPTTHEYNGAWTVGLMRGFGVAALLVVLAGPIAALFGEPSAAPIIQALALRPALEAAASIGVARLTREMSFRRLALIALPASLVDLGVALGTVQWLGVWALVAGSLAGAAATVALSYALAPFPVRLTLRIETIAPLVRYGRWILLTGVVALLGSTVTQVAVSRMEGIAALGLYFLAVRVAFLPIEAASAVVSAVAFPMFARLRADAERTVTAFGTLLTGQAVVLLPIYAIMLVLAPGMETVLGERWQGTGPIVQIFAIAGMTALLGELAVPLLMGRGRADRAFLLEVVQSGVLLLVLLPLVMAYGANGAALAWLTGNVAALALTLAWLRDVVPGGMRIQTAPLLAASGAAFAGAAAAGWGAMAVTGAPGVLTGGVAGLAVAAGVLVLFDRWLALNLWELASWIRGVGTGGALP
jgi:O-antigen/teichoic acid export membrane protein